ncbi:MAG: hypothetical protein AAF270_07315 [Pseudomonadota bacterium]
MHDEKPFDWPGQPRTTTDADTSDHESVKGTDVFRSWLNRTPTSRRRASFDPAIYTWKGYRQWKDGVDKQWIESED